MTTFIEVFNECFENASLKETVALHNHYCCEGCMDDYIYENDVEQLNELFSSPSDAVRAAFFGDYKYNDDYFWFNGSGNLDSSDFFSDMPIDQSALAKYFEENQGELEYLRGFEEAYEWEEGCDDEDEE